MSVPESPSFERALLHALATEFARVYGPGHQILSARIRLIGPDGIESEVRLKALAIALQGVAAPSEPQISPTPVENTSRLTPTMSRVLQVLAQAQRPMKASLIARALGRETCTGSLRHTLSQMEEQELLWRPEGRGGGYWPVDREWQGRAAGR